MQTREAERLTDTDTAHLWKSEMELDGKALALYRDANCAACDGIGAVWGDGEEPCSCVLAAVLAGKGSTLKLAEIRRCYADDVPLMKDMEDDLRRAA